MNRSVINQLAVGIIVYSTTLIFSPFSSAQCPSSSCPVQPVWGTQPLLTTVCSFINEAALNFIGSGVWWPVYSQIYSGYPSPAPRPPYAPPILVKAVAYTESGWRQYQAGFGGSGCTVISFDCGYGIMQITSGMGGGAGFEPDRVASDSLYNIGTGVKILIDKWNSLPYYIGDNNPVVIENWYYAIWAYNGFVWQNNPNNPIYSPSRPPFDGTQPRGNYPYQELVLGYMAHPPGEEFWSAIQVALPDRSLIGTQPPVWIPTPSPSHIEIPIVNWTVGPYTANAGDLVSLYYQIHNPASTPLQNVRLGAQIRTSSPQGSWLDDSSNDVVVTVTPGIGGTECSGDNTNCYYVRRFRIPQNITAGHYDVRWILVDNGTEELLARTERINTLTIIPAGVRKPADLNGDGYVNVVDFAILMHYWGNTSKPVADINQDGQVNLQDFSLMMSSWYNP